MLYPAVAEPYSAVSSPPSSPMPPAARSSPSPSPLLPSDAGQSTYLNRLSRSCLMGRNAVLKLSGIFILLFVLCGILGSQFVVVFILMFGSLVMMASVAILISMHTAHTEARRRIRRQRRSRRRRIEQELTAVGLNSERISLIMSDRDFTGEDYESLLALDEDTGFSEGMTDTQIDHLGSFSVSKGFGKQCAICIETAEEGDIVRALPCLHQFHRTCIDKWLKRKAECPLCQFPAIAAPMDF